MAEKKKDDETPHKGTTEERLTALEERVTAIEDDGAKASHRLNQAESGLNPNKAPETTNEAQIEVDRKHEEAAKIIEKHRKDPSSVSPKELQDAHANLVVGREFVPGQVAQSGQQTGV